MGRNDRYKNLHRLIDAFAFLRNYQDYELWIAGSSDRRYTPILKAQVQEVGILNLVRFLDYVDYDRLPDLIRGAIALVFPTLWEGFGLPVLEVMACGTPVITSNLASLPEVTGGCDLNIIQLLSGNGKTILIQLVPIIVLKLLENPQRIWKLIFNLYQPIVQTLCLLSIFASGYVRM